MSSTQSAAKSRPNLQWRVVDIAVASAIGVASAFIYWVAALLYTPIGGPLEVLLPGLSGLMNGLWLFAGPLAAVIVRKPGAAIYAEVVAAVLEALVGNQWGGAETFLIGLVQGIGAELVFLFVAYRVWNVLTLTLSGIVSAVGCWGYTFLTHLQGFDMTGAYGLWYLVATVISGALVAGVLMWYLYVGIAKTGALDRFASGREVRGARA
ncbi:MULTISPECIES: ECF transporter S component [Bifidobacterium]|jgi:energy-coupling factor transport system substrate-specific component|uniref:ABC transporter permease n=1 Tax=Bifidobacterium tibiigranuli TaxID=2172043 RepID=A0A5N6RVQ3_9BIFI|nr:ECF transporter S component [Bifidobacterium tibiigranuli]KAE8126415.1 ABC transporter permease [Bifidobacterium tibiigranuli]KAE8126518.1 ABC transporter permease [Bifidobacterium tibiigranuli]MCH3974316.1 ECF transporter S component [Bifidobacterium tibiigranuli]MCH4188879.1 ECF transporter S component [Bifidobacterium tibiigranuli]MCH4203216.1 ECF transporter S component [Bifidobacterium tibiigranuli]